MLPLGLVNNAEESCREVFWYSYTKLTGSAQLLALTSDTSIFIVVTVMCANSIVMAVHKSGLRTITFHIIQEDRTCSQAKTVINSNCSCVESVEAYLHHWQRELTCMWNKPAGRNPSCLQTMLASAIPQRSSQTVPHWLLLQISTRPSRVFAPPWSLMSPFSHPASDIH